MAKKDWKQIWDNKYQKRWDNEKTGESVTVFAYSKGGGKYFWSMSVFNENEEVIKSKRFEDKQPALNYANAYMRTN